MIGNFSSSNYSTMGLDLLKTVVGYFKYLTRTMMSLGFCNIFRVYFFSFSLNFLYWSLASFFSDVFPKTAPKFSTYPLKLLIDYLYAGQLKFLTHLPRLWWPPLPVRPPRPRHCPPLHEIDSLVSEVHLICASLASPPLLPTAVEAVYVSGFIIFYSSFLNTVKLTLVFSFRVGNNCTCS